MATDLFDKLGIGDVDPDKVEREIQLGQAIPPGFYPAVLTKAKTDTIESSGNQVEKLVFEVSGCGFDGKEIHMDVFTDGKDAKSQQTCRNHVIHIGKRIGYLRETNAGGKKSYTQLQPSFADCLGAQVVIEVGLRDYEDKNGRKRKTNEVVMFGVHSPNEIKPEQLGPKAEGSTSGEKKSGGRGGKNETASLVERPRSNEKI